MSNRRCVQDGWPLISRAQADVRSAARVLVVDDDSTTRGLTREALRWFPCEVSAAPNADEARELVRTARPDVIIVSASLAVFIGALLQDGALSGTPVIAFSGGTTVPVADAVLRTPIDTLELLATVRLLAANRALDGT